MSGQESAWSRSHDLVRIGQKSEIRNQEVVIERAKNIVWFMDEGFSREDAEKMAGESIFRGRLAEMVDELVSDLIQPGIVRMTDPAGNPWVAPAEHPRYGAQV
jgi:hypothetical protein